jgi:uncharacterized YigZ family protein
MITVEKNIKTEFTERKSVFIGQTFWVTSEHEAEEAIASVRKEYADATHVCYAYILRAGSLQRFSDDGEPSGTAGMPILHVISAKKLCDTLITVTRYFGGILLGAGGLVRAYSRSASDAAEEAGTAEIAPFTEFEMKYGYELHSQMERALMQAGAEITDREFAESVRISAVIRSDLYERFCGEIKSVWHKNVEINALNVSERRLTEK